MWRLHVQAELERFHPFNEVVYLLRDYENLLPRRLHHTQRMPYDLLATEILLFVRMAEDA
jgi:hypothetical protein